MLARIVVIEDDVYMREELIDMLKKAGYDAVPLPAFENAVSQLAELSPDLILLDINLPFRSGFEICKEIKAKHLGAVLILTARDKLQDELHALGLGADDYLTKPCNTERLLARTKNLLRRREEQVQQGLLDGGGFLLDPNTFTIYAGKTSYPDIPAVYVDTGLEYPELRDFVKTKDNVIWLRPRYPFTQILEKYGYPIISKEVSDVINGARKGQPYRLARLNGELLDKNGKKSIYNCENYKYLLDAPFKISARCCYHMKKAPLNKFERQSGRHPITGVLACESKLREQSWIKFGCNGFERQRPLSQPLAFWLEEDILRYLKMTGIPYAPIYGDIVESRKKNGTPILKTTGVSRSGCMYCMYGVHLEHEPNRFQLMQVTHPQQYDYCINKLGCGAVLDYIGVPYRNQQLEVDHC